MSVYIQDELLIIIFVYIRCTLLSDNDDDQPHNIIAPIKCIGISSPLFSVIRGASQLSRGEVGGCGRQAAAARPVALLLVLIR